MHNLTTFDLGDVVECGAALRRFAETASSMEEVANEIVGYLYAELRDERNDPALALVRCFKTHPFGSLDGEQQKFARQMGQGGGIDPQTRCLTLLATRGALPEWNDRRLSRGHVAIPLASERIVENAPMIARLITELGLEIGVVVRPTAESVGDLAQKSYNVFHVPEAEGSPYIPAQAEFVVPHGIRSVLGFGGMLPSGNLFAVIMFCRVPVPRVTADLFANVALPAKLAMLPFDAGRRSSGAVGHERSADGIDRRRRPAAG